MTIDRRDGDAAGLLPAVRTWHPRPMTFRLSLHALILALFLTASILAAYVSPATAGMARDAVGIEQTMEASMPCCPSDQNGPKDCTTNVRVRRGPPCGG